MKTILKFFGLVSQKDIYKLWDVFNEISDATNNKELNYQLHKLENFIRDLAN